MRSQCGVAPPGGRSTGGSRVRPIADGASPGRPEGPGRPPRTCDPVRRSTRPRPHSRTAPDPKRGKRYPYRVPRSYATLLLLVSATLNACGPPPDPRPNVLLIVVDTLRADHLGYAGYAGDPTPHIDELAQQSVDFERAYAPAAWTRPSIASILTGLDPLSHGANRIDHALPPQIETLAESFASAGYATGGVVSNVHLLETVGFRQGFDLWDEEHARDHLYVSSERVTDTAVATLDSLTRDRRPWFLFVHYFDPHYVYIDHSEYDDAPAATRLVTGEESMRSLKEKAPSMTPRDLAVLVGRYDEEIRLTDAQIGRLLEHLQDSGADTRTITVFTSDHGEEFGERAAIGHSTLYDEVIRVPLLVRVPGNAEARRIAEPVSLVSITPTLLDLAGIPFDPARFDAGSLAASTREAPPPMDAAPIFSEIFNKHAVTQGRYKLMRDEETGKAALYDLQEDPKETRDLSRTKTGVSNRLAKLLRERRRTRRPPTVTYETDPAMREQLRQLGYTDD